MICFHKICFSQALHVHQLETFSTTALLGGEFFPESCATHQGCEMELNRYKSAATCFELASVFTIIGACLILKNKKGSYGPAIDFTDAGMSKNIRWALVALSGILLFIGCVLQWTTIKEALEEAIGANDEEDPNSRAHAANEYTFMFIVAWFGLAVQSIPMLSTLSPMIYVSYGICFATTTGIVNVGTHDRQLWMVDNSFAGLNEQRAAINPDHDWKLQRAVNVDEDQFDSALSATILIWLGIIICYMAHANFPVGDGKAKVLFAGKASIGLWAASLLCGFIGCVLLWNLDMARPNIHSAVSSALKANTTGTCTGEAFNVLIEPASEGCFGEVQVDAGERFSLNTFAPGPLLNMKTLDNAYTAIFFWTAISFMCQMALFYPVVLGDARGLKMCLVMAGMLWFTIEYAMIWGTGDLTIADSACDSDDSDCMEWKTGFIFLWFQGVLALPAAVMMLNKADFGSDEPEAPYAPQDNAAPAVAEKSGMERTPSIRQSSI